MKKKKEEINKEEKKFIRNISIDRFRGILVFCMIFFQLLEHFKSLGVFATISKHAPDSFLKTSLEIANGFSGIFILPNLTVADLVAPAFIFAISLTMIPSFNRKCEKYGRKKALYYMISRYLIFIGIGIMMSSVNTLLDGELLDGEFDLVDIFLFIVTILNLILIIIYQFVKKKEFGKVLISIIKYVLCFLGVFGILITLINNIFVIAGISEINFGYWLVMQHIGLSGIFAILIMALSKNNSTLYRFIAGLIILFVFSVFHETTLSTLSNYILVKNNMNIIDNTADGGFIGALGYSSILLIYTAISDIYYKNKKEFRFVSCVLVVPFLITLFISCRTFKAWDGSNNLFTAGLSNFLSINKGSISPSYLVITLFTSVFSFMIIDLFTNIKFKFDFFEIWGKNPFIMYILEFLFVGGLAAILPMEDTGVVLAIIEVIIITGILTFIAYRLSKKDKFIKI